MFAQNVNSNQNRVHFGGTLGLSIGSGFTDIVVAPSVIYDVNDYFSAGVGLQGSYVNFKNNFESYIYGASLIGLVNPIEEIQLSAELEQLRVNTTYQDNFKDDFWNTALFLGAGYRAQNVTIGIRYNVLFDKNKSVYNEAFMPFVRVYF
jgi:long-subunit fatty acid transport protein